MRPTRQAFQISRTKSGVGICCRKTQGKALEGPHSPLHLCRPPGIRLGYNWETREHESQGRQVSWQNRTRLGFTFP